MVVSRSNYVITDEFKNTTTIQLTLTYTGKDEYFVKPNSLHAKTLLFTFHTQTYNDFFFKIIDPSKSHYEIPTTGVFPNDPYANFSFPISNSAVSLTYSNTTGQGFDFKIQRKLNNAVVFSTYGRNIIFSDYFVQIGTELGSEYVYGVGERFHTGFKKGAGKWTVFNRDRGQVIDKGQGLQTYGYYPAYLVRELGNFFHITYMRSSNAMDVIMEETLGRYFFDTKIIGGVIDFRFFLGEQSVEVTAEKLHLYMGRAEIPPFWAFGFHQCRWGYKNVSFLKDVLSNYQKNGLPLDTIWSDIDYMIDYEDFTIDQGRFPLSDMKSITDNYHYIPIIDAGIKTSGSAYEEGLKRGVFIRDAGGVEPLKGRVWPGSTTFVDWFHPNATNYWGDMLGRLFDKVKFSGIWLDMNELANFCDGACTSPLTPSKMDYSKDLPYNPGSDNIESHTISLNATHYGNISEANVHAFNGFLQTYATYQFLKSKGKKPFIITRSSTFGSSKYGYHWTGDNYAAWQYLRGSIADNFNIGLFGIQMVGPDICGFGGNTSQELCARWFQLGALYPFARNHNDLNGRSQQPYALGDTVLQSAKINLKLRYTLLKHYYTVFVDKRGIGTIFRPLFFTFPTDNNAYLDQIVDTQLMIGTDLMSAPIIQEGKTSRKVYFPEGLWYDLYTGKNYLRGTWEIENVKLTDRVPLFLREGTGVLLQETSAVTSTKQLDNKFGLFAGMRYDARRSTENQKVYEAVAAILSIKDYNDDTKVDICSREGCNYIINTILTVTSNTRTLEIDVSYAGGLRLNQEVIINELVIYYDQEKAATLLVNPVVITGPRKVVIPLNGANLCVHPAGILASS